MMTEGKRIGRYHTHRLIAERHLTDHSFFRFIIRQAIIDFHSDASSDPSSRLIVRSFFTRFTEYFCGAISQETVKDSGYLERDRGIDARVVVKAFDRDKTETGVRGPVKVRVERVMHPAMPEDISEPAQEGAVEVTYETLGDLVQRFHDHTHAIPVHRIQAIEGVQREQGHRIVVIESAVTALTERVIELERDNRRLRVAEEMEAREAARTLKPLNENGDELEGENGGNGNGGNEGNGNGGNGENKNGNRNGNHGMNYGGFMPVARECTFQDFLKCKPHNFSGTKGIVRLTR
ncbi:hypothetical protein Tco_0630256 [Tanacetum coccineum]